MSGLFHDEVDRKSISYPHAIPVSLSHHKFPSSCKLRDYHFEYIINMYIIIDIYIYLF